MVIMAGGVGLSGPELSLPVWSFLNIKSLLCASRKLKSDAVIYPMIIEGINKTVYCEQQEKNAFEALRCSVFE